MIFGGASAEAPPIVANLSPKIVILYEVLKKTIDNREKMY